MKKKPKTKALSWLLTPVLILALVPVSSVPAQADSDPSTYTVTIPSALKITKSGWTDEAFDITASGSLAEGKMLNVTATSPTNSFSLKSGDNSIPYHFAAAGAQNTAVTSWGYYRNELAAEGGKTESVGVMVSDTDNTPPGHYTDTVTFTAEVKDEIRTLTSESTQWTEGAPYAAAGDVTISGVTVTGDVTLILYDDVTLTINDSLTLSDDTVLTIKSQTEGTGIMTVNGQSGIYASNRNAISGSGKVIVTGGNITAKGGDGGNAYAMAGGVAIASAIEISGGSVTAQGGAGSQGSGYSGGAGGAGISGTLTLSGGTVTATGGNGGNAGGTSSSAFNGGNGGAGISSAVSVTEGTVIAAGGTGGTAKSWSTTMPNGQPYTQYGSAGSLGKGISGTLTTDLSVQGSTDNSAWTDAKDNYKNYRYVKVSAAD